MTQYRMKVLKQEQWRESTSFWLKWTVRDGKNFHRGFGEWYWALGRDERKGFHETLSPLTWRCPPYYDGAFRRMLSKWHSQKVQGNIAPTCSPFISAITTNPFWPPTRRIAKSSIRKGPCMISAIKYQKLLKEHSKHTVQHKHFARQTSRNHLSSKIEGRHTASDMRNILFFEFFTYKKKITCSSENMEDS